MLRDAQQELVVPELYLCSWRVSDGALQLDNRAEFEPDMTPSNTAVLATAAVVSFSFGQYQVLDSGGILDGKIILDTLGKSFFFLPEELL